LDGHNINNDEGGVALRKHAEFFKALGDENRLKIVQMLAKKDMCVCEIMDELAVSQPAVSHHLKALKQVGIVEDRREGKWIFYSLSESNINQYLNFLEQLLQSADQPKKPTDCSYCEKLRKQMGLTEEEGNHNPI